MRLKIERLRKNRVFMDNLRWDVTPEILFRPRFVRAENDCGLIKETQGFMFYIDYMKDVEPNLMVMKTFEFRSKTVGEIEGAPRDLLLAAVKKEGVKDVTGMYPIDKAVEAWLKKELGL